MFSKISRYRKLPAVVTADAQGQPVESTSLRPLPEVSGTFQHTVEGMDRLDHLAYKYYKQPRKWWRICDANPAFMSPQALLGKEPIVTVRFRLTFTGPNPPWSQLLKELSAKVGVEKAVLGNVQNVVPLKEIVDGVERYHWAAFVTFNRMNIDAGTLKSAIENFNTEGRQFEVRQIEIISRLGKQIIIPPDVIG